MKNLLFAYAKNTLKLQISFALTVQILCFRDIDSRIPKLAKFEISRYAVRFLMDLFGNPNDAFFRDLAQIKVG